MAAYKGRRNGPVITKFRAEFPRGNNNNPRGTYTPGRPKGKTIGDTQPMFGKDVVAFKGGEGGRNWAVRSTSC